MNQIITWFYYLKEVSSTLEFIDHYCIFNMDLKLGKGRVEYFAASGPPTLTFYYYPIRMTSTF